jgi:hypothetical protein
MATLPAPSEPGSVMATLPAPSEPPSAMGSVIATLPAPSEPPSATGSVIATLPRVHTPSPAMSVIAEEADVMASSLRSTVPAIPVGMLPPGSVIAGTPRRTEATVIPRPASSAKAFSPAGYR